MASNYPSSTETTNFARLSRSVVDICCGLLRTVLGAKLPPPGLTAMLKSQRVHLCSNKNLEYHQRQFLYPPSGTVFSGTLEDLDFSLLYRLVRNLQNINIPPHRNGWGKPPDNADRTLSANIDRLRLQRNEAYGHLPTASLSDAEFNDRWDIIRQSVLEIENAALTGDTYVKAVDALLTMSMDPDTEKYYIEKLEKHYKADLEVKTIALDVKGAVADAATKLKSMALDMGVIKHDVAAALNATAANTRHTQEIHPDFIPMIDDHAFMNIMTATRSHAKKIHADLEPMIETTKAMITEEVKKMFINTKFFRDSKEKIQKNRIVVIKGNTGDGKTTTAIQLIHWLSQEPGRQPLKLHKMKHFDLIAPKSKIITFVDDMFGDLCEREVREWNKSIQSVMPKLCGNDSEANFLVITVRNDVFNLHKQHSFEQFTDSIIDLGSSVYNVSEEKFELLDHYQPIAEDCKLSKQEKEKIVTFAPNLGFPQCCRLFRDIPELQKERVKFFEQPFRYLNDVLSRLQGCPALLYLFLNNGMMKVNDLDPNSKKINNTLLDEAFEINLTDGDDDRTTLTYKKKVEFVKKSLDSLLGFLIVKEKHEESDDEVYRFYHDSIYVAVALLYGEKTRKGYIQNCPSKSLSYLTTSKTSPNMIVISCDHYTDMCERLLREFVSEKNDISTSIGSLDVWKDRVFVERFVRLLNDRKVDKLAVLNKACSSCAEECALYLLCEGVKPDKDTPFCVVEGGSVDVLREILQYDVTPTARNDDNNNVLYQACRYVSGREEMVTVLCDEYPHLVHDTDNDGLTPLHIVAATGNFSMFDTVERTVLKSLCRVEDEQHKCETVDGRVVHVSCVCAQYMSQLVDDVNRATVLHVSCRYKQRKMCKFVCERYPTLTTIVDKDGRHCLHYIAQYTSDVDMFTECETHVKQYVESTGREYDITTILTSLGATVLHTSCAGGQRKMCKFVCERYPTLTTIVDKDGRHCLHYIARLTSDVDMFTECETHVKQYVESTGREYDITTILTSRGETVLHMSCEGGQRKMCKFVCERYPTLTTIVDKDGCHCLHYIAQCTSDVDMFTECETHVKQYVESTGREYDITTILTSRGETVLHMSCVMGQRKMCKFLCERYPTLTTIVDKYGRHCLHVIAGFTSDVDMFTECETHVKQYLESTGREYDITTILTIEGSTVLHMSCVKGQRKMCKFVCERYPTLTTIVDKYGYHCLHDIAQYTSDVDMFTECETRVKQYLESTGREYDITTILTSLGSTVLHKSCLKGQRKMCKFVCERYPTLTTIVDKDGRHCLHYIAWLTSDVDMFTECETHVKQYLESTGREYDITTILTSDGATVLHMSCVGGQRKMCKFVCERYPTLTTIVDKDGCHCLHYIAGFTSDVDMFTECETHVKQYLESTGREYDITTILTIEGSTVLHMSCVKGQRKMCKFVCERYPTLTTIVDKYGQHCLHYIAQYTSDVDMFTECETHVKQYVESTGREYDITTILTSDGQTVLHMSCMRGQRKMYKFLCERYPTLTTIVDKDGCHCLHYIAMFTSDVDMFTDCETHVKQYLESTGREYDITTILTCHGSTVLHMSCVMGQRKMCKFVCERYPTLTTIVDKLGRHCLHYIARFTSDVDMFTECETRVKQYLESTGREYDITTILSSDGSTVLHMSCGGGQRKMCKFVCERYPTLTTIVDKYGQHCLHYIAQYTSDVDMFTECETRVKQYVESTGREYDITTILTSYRSTVLHMSCGVGQRKMCKFVCERYPTLTTIVDKYGQHCLHYIAQYTSDVDMFTECETHVKQYVESTGREYDITTILTSYRSTVLHMSCVKGQRKMCKFVCERYPTLTTIVDKYGQHCLHYIAQFTSDVDMFTECETHVKQYVESTGREYDITTILTSDGQTVLHMSCVTGQRKMYKFLCEGYPTLTTIVDKYGRHCLHVIAMFTSDVDMFTECETRVKQYLESTGREYDITTILTSAGRSVLDLAKYKGTENNPLYDHIVKVFGSK